MLEAPRYTSFHHAFVIVGRPNCPWCDKAKALLELHRHTYAYIDLSQHPEERARLVEAGIKTVPQVWNNATHIGGYEALEDFLG